MAPSPINPFWAQVKAQALAGCLVVLMTGILGGVVYLTYTVPGKLDEVLSRQMEFKGRLENLEREVDGHGERIIRLESSR